MSRSLHFYTSQEVVRQRFKEFHGGEVNAGKARSIATHVEQGLNFFDASTSVPVSIKPLTQYYGVAALTRAVAMYCSKTLTERTLTQGHGLSISNWSVIQADSPQRGLPLLNLKVVNGLFTDLSSSTDEVARFLANSTRPNWRIKLGAVAPGTEFTFQQLLTLIPDLWPEHKLWTQAEPPPRVVLKGVSTDAATQRARWTMTTSATAEQVKALFPHESAEPAGAGEVAIETSTSAHVQPVQLHHGAFDIGDVLLVPPVTPDGGLLPTAAILYAASYVMSMLARYRLSDWLAIWRGEKGDSARPLMERLMALIQSEFPKVCADAMQPENT